MKIYLNLPIGDMHGWGVCGSNIIKELKKRDDVELVETFQEAEAAFVCIEDIALRPYKGWDHDKSLWYNLTNTKPIIGYCFFEEELPDIAIEHSKLYDLILAGSTWCADKLREKGIMNVDVLLQGIDPELFYPCPPREQSDRFTLFSGGKFEYRKGQDIVLAAFKLLQDKYPKLKLATNWYNQWDFSRDTMERSEYIVYNKELVEGRKWSNALDSICLANEIDHTRVYDIGVVPNHMLRSYYAQTDLGVFPNRCEGGTNLVLMEYMACGRPVIMSKHAGHQDIVDLCGGYVIGDTLENVVYNIETCMKSKDMYVHKETVRENLTWEKTVNRLIEYLRELENQDFSQKINDTYSTLAEKELENENRSN